jgi:hypothetical protein
MAWFRAGRIRDFWRWCAAQPLSEWPPDRALLDELGDRLHAIDDGLAFEMCARDGKVELAISADGDRDRLDLVREIVAAAPAMSIRVVAFRQRSPAAPYQLRRPDGSQLGSDDIWFAFERDEQGLGLHLFIRDLPDDDDAGPLQSAVYLLLDNALGELDVVTQIAWINWEALPDQRDGLAPLADLAPRFDTLLGRVTP